MKYKCKKCGTMSQANSFEQIVEMDKLCPTCKSSKLDDLKRIFHTKPKGKVKTILRICNSCGVNVPSAKECPECHSHSFKNY